MPDTAPALGGTMARPREAALPAVLEVQLAALGACDADAADAPAIATSAEASPAAMQARPSRPVAAILAEVEQLGRTIAEAKLEIAALHIDDINGAFIASATDELDAIVDATACATNEILDCVETVEKLAATVPAGQAEALRHVATRIYEACSFQDITGQRVTKVVSTLKTIEARVHAIIATFGEGEPPLPAALAPPDPDARLLNGPQLPGNGVDQASIDALFD
jgi:chemotaxis protein CheZ